MNTSKLSKRAQKVLEMLRIKDVKELSQFTREQVSLVRQCGKKTLSELGFALLDQGLLFAGEDHQSDSIVRLKLSPRIHRALARAGITQISQIQRMHGDQLERIPDMSYERTREIDERFMKLELYRYLPQ